MLNPKPCLPCEARKAKKETLLEGPSPEKRSPKPKILNLNYTGEKK